MNDSINNENVRKISRDVIEYLLQHPNTSKDKITNIKGRVGKKYNCLSCHDSCWRSDGVETFIKKYYDKLIRIDGLSNWYEKIEVTEEIDNQFRQIERESLARFFLSRMSEVGSVS